MNPKLTIITPMYNEAEGISDNIEKMIKVLESLNISWEYILVDDGSTDDSYALAQKAFADRQNCRLIHYTPNRGRGYALRQGFDIARGKYVITTESDLSWGPDVIAEIYDALIRTGDDIIIVSPHLSEEGFENVPFFRRKLSYYGNKILHRCFKGNLTMLSGMTRGYRREVIQSIHLEEDEKQIHLEIISKAQLLGCRISEIPGKIRWESESSKNSFRQQLSIVKHIIPHILDSVVEGAFKIFIGISLAFSCIGFLLIVFGALNKIFLITKTPKPFLINYGLGFFILAVLSVFISVLSLQIIGIKKHLVHLQSQIRKLHLKNQP